MKKIEAIWLPEVQQQVFRALMGSMSRPGRLENIAILTEGDSPIRGVLATLLDAEVSFCDHVDLLDANDWPLLQAEKKPVEQAQYILCRGDQSPDFEPMLGSLSSPELSATIVLKVASVSEGDCQLTLSGPGIDGQTKASLKGFHSDWLTQRTQWNSAFPLGVDFILVDEKQVFALPRTTHIEVN